MATIVAHPSQLTCPERIGVGSAFGFPCVVFC